MKTFKQLSIGDNYYILNNNIFSSKFLDEKHRYNYIEKASIIQVGIVKSLNTLREGGISLNDSIDISKEGLSNSIFEVRNNKYLSDKKEYYSIIRKLVLNELKSTKESINNFEIKQEKRIIDIRKKYWEFLN